MKKYETIEISISYLQNNDIITSSTVFDNGDDETEKIPFAYVIDGNFI